ncbi:hypothetical protein HK100_003250 [Physocladia obscura]|uniref:Protein phosphatase n=1 Tax=Physocladia obscura TaxID=109957 RepID=A0AAD5XIG9_9FUNG|nr:hypothetical protein HK100_003250 [Physocladia obscura]
MAHTIISAMALIAPSLPRPTFEFKFAAAGSAKDTAVEDSSRMQVDVDPAGLCVRVGEDAYFVRKDGLGVADGVGGWAHVFKGSNAALFSSRLMYHVASQLDYFDDLTNDYDINEYYLLDPIKVLQVACERTLEDAGKGAGSAVGSTTALIAFLRLYITYYSDDELRLASLGDSSLMILRDGAIIFRTEEQQHSFNFPYQLGSNSKDTPEKDAGKWSVKIKEGDVVIVGSDGIFDNLFDEDILEIVNAVVLGTSATASFVHPSHYSSMASFPPVTTAKTPGAGSVLPARILRTDPQLIASEILAKARDISTDTSPNVSSPFQERAVNEGIYYQGGKSDDLTVVVGIIRVSEDSPDRR